MEKHTQELLKQLAEKLGTTVNNIWNILLYQAKIDAYTTLFQFALIALFGFFMLRLNKKFAQIIPEDKRSNTYYEKYDVYLTIPMFVSFLLFFGTSFVAFFNIPEVINCFFNPEYWALQKILTAIE